MVFPPLLRGFVPSCAILFETPGIRLARAVVEYEVEHWGVENQRITSCGFSGRDFLVLALFS